MRELFRSCEALFGIQQALELIVVSLPQADDSFLDLPKILFHSLCRLLVSLFCGGAAFLATGDLVSEPLNLGIG